MSRDQLTGVELREAVFEVVARELGPAALVRYIAENFSQPGRDYTAERATRAQPTVQEAFAEVERLKAERGGSLAPPGAKIIGGEAGSPQPK